MLVKVGQYYRIAAEVTLQSLVAYGQPGVLDYVQLT
jgi:hypothetical protein